MLFLHSNWFWIKGNGKFRLFIYSHMVKSPMWPCIYEKYWFLKFFLQVLSLAFLATVTNAEITHQLPLRPKHGHGPKGPYGPPHPHPTPLGPYGPVKHYGVKPKPYTPAPYHATTVSNSYYSVRCFGNINVSKMLPARLLGFLKKFLPTLLRPLIDFHNFYNLHL